MLFRSREIIGKNEFEFVRTQGRAEIEAEAEKLIQAILDDYGAGVELADVQLQKIDPPGNVLDAFRDVQAARADKERTINEATAYYNEVVQRAEGEAQRTIKDAEGYREQMISIATGETQRFLSVLGQYNNEKEITRRRIYLETMRGILAEMDKVLIDERTGRGSGGVVPYLPLNELMKSGERPRPGPLTGGEQQQKTRGQ